MKTALSNQLPIAALDSTEPSRLMLLAIRRTRRIAPVETQKPETRLLAGAWTILTKSKGLPFKGTPPSRAGRLLILSAEYFLAYAAISLGR